MGQRQSAAKRTAKATKKTLIEHLPGDGTPSRAEKSWRPERPGRIYQLNLDVLFLIAASLHPMDLLNFARTCKSLQQLLMDEHSAFAWKAARRQVDGLPDCPDDLTEQEYATLVFDAHCHGCGASANTVLWRMRRRYCHDCRVERFCSIYSCHEVISRNDLIVKEHVEIEGETTTTWVDKEQMLLLTHEYKQSSGKERFQFMIDKQIQYATIIEHAYQCEKWQRKTVSVDPEVHLQKQEKSILKRLEQLGYEREVAHFGPYEIQRYCKALFRKSKPLTNKEWNRIRPRCIETMNDFRSRRLENVVYPSRQYLLASEYADYLARPSSDAPAFDLLPDVADVAILPPFRDAIRAPGEPQMDKLFESAFLRLPELVVEWRKKLDAEVAELVKIPSHLSSKSVFNATDKLRLACALFTNGTNGPFTHPVVFYTTRCTVYPRMDEHELENTESISDRYGIKYMAEAPYVIHACGLDPGVATVDDMDRRNARLRCLSCASSRVGRWRDAVWHAHSWHKGQPPSWQVISDEHIAAIQIAKRLPQKESPWGIFRCLLCLPSVGDVIDHQSFIALHFATLHKTSNGNVDIQPDGGKVTLQSFSR